MLIDLINGIREGNLIVIFSAVLSVPIFLFSLTFHECAHGFVAYKLGDPTAKAYGRLTLNPKAHLDPVGAILMLFSGIGWAKPVPINPNYFKNRKCGMAITAVAGPLSNLLLAFIGLLIFQICNTFLPVSVPYAVLAYFFYAFALTNIGLAIFNLIPVPPLVGSRLLNLILPERYYFKVMRYERQIYLVLVLLLFSGVLRVPLTVMRNSIADLFMNLISLIPFLG